ncbi:MULTISPECIES: energy transducer TonB [Providencia]|uniref:energy transducer TonB n=1 Tax=Providencia TaxID=586 RepID=UPI00234BF6FE|nr:energy transducer TonB [Providencia sp. PROV197]
MTIHPSFRYKLALTVSLVIHITAIVFIALQTGRALPIVEGVETITLSLGGPMSSQGSSSLASHQGEPLRQTIASEQISKSEPISQQKPANKAQNPPKRDPISANIPIDDTVESPLLTQKTKVMKKPKPVQPAHKSEQNTPHQLVADNPPKKTENQLITKDPHQITPSSSQDKAQAMTSNAPEKNGSTATPLASENSPSGQGINALSGNSQFAANGDGSYTALGSSGISYTILQDANPKYPKEARSLGYTKVVKVQIRLLVGLDGQVESVEILNSKIPDLGFKEEAVKAIKKMAFKPIIYQGQNIKMYFKKTVVFQY